ncbi:hypothetical protein [Psychroserpens sp.]|uniref:hypothetical protein n=1 Tax=Psychroserpens sp. TaxID=2020870 RepID=UPI003C77DC6C
MDLEARKYKFTQRLSKVNEPLLKKLESTLKTEIEDSQRITLDQYNKEIDKAVEAIKKGDFHTQEEAKEIADTW